jgi:hypothetical protein
LLRKHRFRVKQGRMVYNFLTAFSVVFLYLREYAPSGR